MNEFTLWYTYYDSLFLNVNPKLSQLFYEEYPSIKLDIIFRNQNGLTIFVLVFLWFFNSFKILSNNLLIGSIHNVNYNNYKLFRLLSINSCILLLWKNPMLLLSGKLIIDGFKPRWLTSIHFSNFSQNPSSPTQQ
jgi:hypothetical protein